MKLSLKLLTTICILNYSLAMAKDLKMTQEEEKLVIQKAKKALKIVGGGLLHNVQKNLKEGGVMQAADFCSDNASDLTKRLIEELDKGVNVRRITNSPRNPNNIPQNDYEKNMLEKISKKETKQNLVTKKIAENHYQVYKAIYMKGSCLLCHGDATQRNPEGYNIISKNYPNDKAINYKLGDFRGVFLVDIIQ